MLNRVFSPVPLVLALALAVASPAMAQGRGNGNGNGNGNGKAKSEQVRKGDDSRPVLQRRTDDRDDEERYDEWYDAAGARRSVPRGWCQGKGNPHNTVENCGYSAAAARNGRIGDQSRSGSYAEQHADFHRYLDDKYRTLAAQRPLDVGRQLQLRAQKSAEHERWHDQVGRNH
jgi:hypothetical protein